MSRLISNTIWSVLLCILFGTSVLGQAPTNPKKSAVIESGESRTMKVFALRLKPGQDLRTQIESFAKDKQLEAGFVITTVGSLSAASIRLADQPTPTKFEGKYEIVSLVGTLSKTGVHLHISISDSSGRTIGGHLVEGCLIYTTAEIVIGEADSLTFNRETDAQTTYQELTIRKRRVSKRRPH